MPAPKGELVQLFEMRRRVGKGFHSTAPMSLMGSEGIKNTLSFP